MRLWIRYLREKRNNVLVYLTTVFFFVTVGSLYHIENLEKLLYAALLTFVIWAAVSFRQGIRYVRRSAKLEEAFRYFEETGELPGKMQMRAFDSVSEGIEDAESFQEAQERFLSLVYESKAAERQRWEESASESRDYYMMWTHQIKTPIAAMKLLFDRVNLQDRDTFLMKEELFKIEQYVEMVLTFQRLGGISSDLVLTEYALDALVRQSVKKYSVLFINKGLALELGEMDFRVVTDEKWFIFCLEQLLSNSIKYTGAGGISIRAEEAEAGCVRLLIKDTGIGIRAEDLPRIFEKGFTGYNGRLDKRSTGIGLYLCRRIFDHLGIGVWVESREGEGTEVALRIPGPSKGNLR